MYTGLIQDIGTIEHIDQQASGLRFALKSRKLASKVVSGQSLAVRGVCLTVEKKQGNVLIFFVMPETLRRTGFSALKRHDRVNLELPLRLSDRLGGHFVQGHVDGILTVEKCVSSQGAMDVTVTLPLKWRMLVIEKGSIALDGVSLTIAKKRSHSFDVSFIPETLLRTTLGRLRPGSKVHVEFDFMGKYVIQYLRFHSPKKL